MAEAESLRKRHRTISKTFREAGFIRSSPVDRLGRSCRTIDQPSSARLRETLERLGPLYVVFGLYISSRPDVMPLSDCLELNKIDQTAGSPTPKDEVSRLISAELGEQPDDIFQHFEYVPVRQGLIYQWHRAVLESGEDVVVKILHPRFEILAARNAELLPVLEEIVLIGQDGVEFGLSGMVEDFRPYLDSHLDLGREAAALEELASDKEEAEGMTAPELFSEFSSRRIITTAVLEGKGVGCLSSNQSAGDEENQGGDKTAADSARRLCLAWLHQALFGGLYPVGPFGKNIVLLPNNRFAVVGGLFGRLRQNSRRTLFNYLTAASRHEPDRACAYLLRETIRESGAVTRDDLRIQFRQAEPFRTGGWGEHYIGQRLAEYLFIHWRLASRHGYPPSAPLEDFFRGLYGIELLARQMAPHRDELKKGLDDLRVIAAAVHLRQTFALSRLKKNFEQSLPEYVELWSRVDEAAVLLEGGRFPDEETADREQDAGRTKRYSWLAVLGLTALFVSGNLVINRMSPLDGAWVEVIGVLALAPLAAVILFIISRENGR